MQKKKPEISVIMGIYNCEKTLPMSIDSIIHQTYADWELILCDDGSQDGTYEVAVQYQKKNPDRIILLKNDYNLGLNQTLNNCLKKASGRFIARMDGDDICDPHRFEKELKIFDEEPELAIVSSDMSCFDEEGEWGCNAHPTYPTPKDFMHGTPFCHAPCLVKKEAYDAVGGYSVGDKYLRVEDYHLWLKMYAKGYRGKNIHQNLYSMRDDRNAYTRRKFRYRINEAYIRHLAIHEFQLSPINYIYVLRPILVGLLPDGLYRYLHRKKLG